MLFNIDPTTTASWKKLTKHHKATKHTTISELFHQDKDRFEKYSTTFDDILVDYSKNNISDDAKTASSRKRSLLCSMEKKSMSQKTGLYCILLSATSQESQ